MRAAIVVDTNVAIVANERTPQASLGCVQSCVQSLKQIQAGRRVLLDQSRLILEEYRRYLSHSGQPRTGDAFFKWLWDRQADENFCTCIPLTPLDEDQRQFAEFPDDPDLTGFDPSDQKFVAVAVASGEQPPILNASDTDWWLYEEALARHVQIEFICPELMTPHA
jgi:hypothetical protein